MSTLTVFGGVLARTPHGWIWSDGTPEPRVSDLSWSAVGNFRCRSSGGTTYVEVPLSVCHREPDLRWVLDAVSAGEYRQDLSGDHVGPRVLTEEGLSRMHVAPGEDPMLGHEPIVRKRAIPRVALVPWSVWERWATEHPYGATWAQADEESLFARAESLGWVRPH